MKSQRDGIGRGAWAWALYDWGNSAFATTVLGVFFPIFFKQFWCAGDPVTTSTARLGVLSAAASVVVAVLSPWLGAVADRLGLRKRFLLGFTALGVAMTGGLWFAGRGQWLLAGGIFLLASTGFSGAISLYDSLLVGIARPKDYNRVSALGFSLGYLGGGLLFAFNILMSAKPGWFGLADAAEAVRVSFLTVAVWWAVFTVPLLLWVPETPGEGDKKGGIRAAFGELVKTLRSIRAHRPAFLFLLAYWLYIDGVDTVVRMAVDYGLSLGFPSESLMTAFLVTQFVGFPAAILYGKLGDRIGVRRAIYLGLAVYTFVVLLGYTMTTVREFYYLAVLIGLVQGGVQALSRSYYAHLIPPEKSGEYFGFYNMLGKFAAIFGPLLMGLAAALTENPRAAVLPILLLFAGGALIFHFVEEPKALEENHRP